MASDTSSNTKNDIGITEKTYATSEVAKLIGIAPVTVRKYSQLLESKGYVFIRSTVKARQQARLYRYKDIETLRYLTNIRKDGRITVEQATSVTIERLGKGAIQAISSTDTAETSELEQYNKRYEKLERKVDKQSELLVNQSKLLLSLNEKLEKQDKYLSQLTASKEIEAPKQIETAKPTQKKKSLFNKLFSK